MGSEHTLVLGPGRDEAQPVLLGHWLSWREEKRKVSNQVHSRQTRLLSTLIKCSKGSFCPDFKNINVNFMTFYRRLLYSLCLKIVEATGVLTQHSQGVGQRLTFDPGNLSNGMQGQAWVGVLAKALGNLEDIKHSEHR